MRIRNIKGIPGPNVFHHEAVSVLFLELEDLAETHSAEIPNFIPRLLETLPGLNDHHCSPGHRGGFVERLHRGTYFAHIVEHVALELSIAAGIPVSYGKTVYGGSPGLYKVVVRSDCEAGMAELLRIAVELADSAARGVAFDFRGRLEEARRVIRETVLGPSTKAIMDAALKRGIPCVRLNGDSLLQMGYGRHRKLVQAALSSGTSAVSADIAGDKRLTKRILAAASIPVPDGTAVASLEAALKAFEELGPPVAVKPLDANHGKGVTLSLATAEQVSAAFFHALSFSSSVIVERSCEGRDYRVLVIGGKLTAASERVPACVTGDGKSSVVELVERENANPLRGDGHDRPLTRIVVDEACENLLKRRGLSLDKIPMPGQKIFLRETANLSSGGTAKDVTDVVHPEVKSVCERAARLIGLDICGIDLILPDIASPIPSAGAGIIEINAGPGLRMHCHPSEGSPRDVGAAIVEMLYPGGARSRIPIAAITGTNGKTTVVRMVGRALSRTGVLVGMTTTDGIFIGDEMVADGDMSGPASAKTVLGDPAVEAAVLETARGGILRKGLGYDWSDVGVVTNIQPDHFGQDGIETLDDILHIKSLVAERVREGGAIVLNADDERLSALPDHPRITRLTRRIVQFSLRPDHPLLAKAALSGGTFYFLRDGWIWEIIGRAERKILRASDIPVTFKGAADFQIANAMAAIAVSVAMGVELPQVVRALADFNPVRDNQGRANAFSAGDGYVLLDYGHNPEAFKAICRMAARLNGRKKTAVVGVPGDRSDVLIRESAKAIASGFNKVIIREDRDLRGRIPGETPGILRDFLKENAPSLDCRVIPDETEALKQALSEMEPDELIAVFFEDIFPLRELLVSQGAKALSTIPHSHHHFQEAERKFVRYV